MEAQPPMTGPEINPEQAARVTRILCAWMERGWKLKPSREGAVHRIDFTDPEVANSGHWDDGMRLQARGVSAFDALCQATTAMQALLEEYPEKP